MTDNTQEDPKSNDKDKKPEIISLSSKDSIKKNIKKIIEEP